MRTIQIMVRGGDRMVGEPGTREGARACVRQAVPDLTLEEVEKVTKALRGKYRDLRTLKRTLTEVLGSDVAILDAPPR